MSARMTPPMPLDDISRDDNPGPFVLEPQEFVEDVQLLEEDAETGSSSSNGD
jgi:hypothetical protein